MEANFPICPPGEILEIIRRLESAGFEAWCVGGCVRDSLLGKTPYDWDVTTSALPQETKSCFPEERLLEVGALHGTITLLPPKGRPVEITTFRREGTYTDGRHPDQVIFSTHLEDDLSRRDFTVNAMAYHPSRGLVDLFGGQEDLQLGLLRCVGNPARRFSEDALRILRCLRFSATLGLQVEKSTAQALWEKKELLLGLSPQRVREELTKLLCGNKAPDILRNYGEIFFTLLPELAPMATCAQETPYHCYNVWEHTLHALEHIPPASDLRWAALLHDVGKPSKKIYSPDGVAHFYGHPPESGKLTRTILTRLQFSNREIQWIGNLVDHHEDSLPMTDKALRKLLGTWGERFVFRLFQLMEADMSAKAPGVFERRMPDVEESRRRARAILERGDCLHMRDLALHGQDLKGLGIAPGPAMGQLLNRLFDAVQDGLVPNEKEALTQLVRQWEKTS